MSLSWIFAKPKVIPDGLFRFLYFLEDDNICMKIRQIFDILFNRPIVTIP